MEQANIQKTRPSRACGTCHEKKIRCDLVDGKPPCSNCRLNDASCRPHQRKRKRPVLRESSPRANNNAGAPAPDRADPAPSLRRRRVQIPTQSELSPIGPLVDTPEREVGESTEKETPRSLGYLGRAEYLGAPATNANENAELQSSEKNCLLSEEERTSLEVHRAFELPPLAVQRSLIDSFMTYCAPWMPIVEPSWLRESETHSPSLLLLQSVFLAGSRVAAASHISALSEKYYRRAKALFFSSYEKNPITKIVAACLLNWWNPSAPEEVSLDSSIFWLRIAVSLAYQIGLYREPPTGKTASYRRRLWWTLVARDCQISAAHGRPRGISLPDSDVSPPTPLDFPSQDENAELFVAFVNICTIMGDVTQSYLRHQLSPGKRREIRNALYCWVNELPTTLRLFQQGPVPQLTPYHLHMRHLYVKYFVILTILYRSAAPQEVSTTVAVVASSFICGIFEEFLARDDLRFLSPTFKFYAFAAGMAQVNARAYLSISDVERELDIINSSLNALAKRWPSAQSNNKILQNLSKSMPTQTPTPSLIPLSSHHDAFPLFQPFGPELCHKWYLVEGKRNNLNSTGPVDLRWTTRTPDRVPQPGSRESQVVWPVVNNNVPLQSGNFLTPADSMAPVSLMEQPSSDGSVDVNAFWPWPMLESSGNWLVGDFPGNLPW